MREGWYQCRPASSFSVTSNAQVLSSLPGHHLATSLWNCTHNVGTVPLHPEYRGFSLLWVCVWSVASKPRRARACWPGCGELWLRKHRTGWMPDAMTTRHSCFGDRGTGARQSGRGVCTSGATKVPLGAASAMRLSGAIAAYANTGELAWVPAVRGSK